MSDYHNANGLVGGKIPAGVACPFKKVCQMANESCPSKSNLKSVDYSCAAARAHSLILLSDCSLLRNIFHKPASV